LGRDVAVITGPEACELWLDEDRLTREAAAFDHIFELFGGASLSSLDGATHRTRKTQVMAAFDRTALERYLPGLESNIGEALDLWADADEIRWVDALRSLAIAAIADNMLGLRDPQSVDGLVADYAVLTSGFVAFPFAVPGSPMHRAKQARDRLIAFMRDCVAESRITPHDDGLSRILSSKGPDGALIADEHAALEAHHIFMAGYIVCAELAGLILRLDHDDAVREAVATEVRAHAAEGVVTMKRLAKMTLLHRVVQEVKRITPMVPILFARAKKPIAFKGVTIPEGWQVSLALHESQMLGEIYPEPAKFDPDRFSEQRAEHRMHEHAFAPQGPGPATGHKCAGTDYATYFMMMFAVLLLRDYTWELPSQDLSYDCGRLPPEPRDGLRARLTRLPGDDAPR
jgi:cytochrome P450